MRDNLSCKIQEDESYSNFFVCVVLNFSFGVQIIPPANKIIRVCRTADWRMRNEQTCNIQIYRKCQGF